VLGLYLPVIWYKITQCIKVVTPGKVEREKNENGFNGFLHGLLSKPTDMARHNNATLQ